MSLPRPLSDPFPREELVAYDPAVAALCKEVDGENNWHYRRSDDPARQGQKHLKQLDRTKLPYFQWTEAEAEEKAYKKHNKKKP